MKRYRIEIWAPATKEAPARVTRVLPLDVSKSAPAGYARDLAARMSLITGTEWRITEEKESKA